MTVARAPAHVTCFVRPGGPARLEAMGSSGAGIRLAQGSTADVREASGRTRIFIGSEEARAHITRMALGRVAPGRHFTVHIDNSLPMGQGFGMSAAGALAAALAAADIAGGSREEAFMAAHAADIEGGGGLGDVAGILCEAHQPTRLSPGLPPFGEAVDRGLAVKGATAAILGPKMSTASVLGDPGRRAALCDRGGEALEAYMAAPASLESLFRISNAFSSAAGVEGPRVRSAIRALEAHGIPAAMCMLGNSVIALATEGEVAEIIGDAALTPVESTPDPAGVIRKG